MVGMAMTAFVWSSVGPSPPFLRSLTVSLRAAARSLVFMLPVPPSFFIFIFIVVLFQLSPFPPTILPCSATPPLVSSFWIYKLSFVEELS